MFSFSTLMKQIFRCASLCCIFSAFDESPSNTFLSIQYIRTLAGFLYPPQGAELLHQKRCSAQHCSGCAAFLNICLYRASASHLTVRQHNERKNYPVLMKVKLMSSKSVKHNMHGPSETSRVSLVSSVANSCRF